MTARLQKQHGSTMLEFVLTGIPMIFIVISIVQMAYGMWQYHTVQYAVKVAGNYLAVHGSDCAMGSNSCGTTIGGVAQVLENNAIGIDATRLAVTFNAIESDHATVASSVTCTLNQCVTNTTAWPPLGYNYPMTNDIEIKTEYQFRSALSMVTPGPGATPVQFGTIWFPGFTHQTILF